MMVGREAIRALYEQLLAQNPDFKHEEPLPTLRIGEFALTARFAATATARCRNHGHWSADDCQLGGKTDSCRIILA